MSYTKLANSILTSTIWMEDDQTRLVWLTLLAMADKNGEVQASIPGLANVARVTVESCHAAIDKFLSPDPYSRTKDDEGRRIEEIRGGWVLINHAEYRNLASDEDRKEKAAERQRRCRERARRNGENIKCHKMSHQNSQADTKAKAKSDKKKTVPSESDTNQFELFWAAYPRKTAKGNARKAWATAVKQADPETIIAAAGRYAKSVTDPKFTAHPATWLNAERWLDEDMQPTKKPRLPDFDTPDGMAELERLFAEGLHT